jgi:hypothetical protein
MKSTREDGSVCNFVELCYTLELLLTFT